jgi:hypothetical protein
LLRKGSFLNGSIQQINKYKPGDRLYKGDYFIKYDSYYYRVSENNAKVLIKMYEKNEIPGEYDLYGTMVKITTGENI